MRPPLRSPNKNQAAKTAASPGSQKKQKPKASSNVTTKGKGNKSVSVAKSPTKPPVTGAAKRKQTKPVLRDIIRLQSTVEPQIPRAPFSRLVREIMQRTSRESMRLSFDALEALRECSENYIVHTLSDSYLITLNRRQATLQPRDLQLVLLLRGA